MNFNINEFTQYFQNPAVSRFNRNVDKSFTIQIGPWIPGNWELLGFGNSKKSESGHKFRMMPLLAPAFADLSLQEHSAVVPLRVIMSDYEATFNYATNLDGASLPHITVEQYHTVLAAMLRSGISPVGSLLDYLGYPVYADIYEEVYNNISDFNWNDGNSSAIRGLFDFPTKSEVIALTSEINGFIFSGSLSYRGLSLSWPSNFRAAKPLPFVFWALRRNLPSLSQTVVSAALNDISVWNIEGIASWLNSTVVTLTNEYINYVYSFFFFDFLKKANFSSVNDKPITTLPLRAYFRCHYDWNTNGNFTNRDFELERNVYGYEEALLFSAESIANHNDPNTIPTLSVNVLRELTTCKNRLWDFDYSTSLLPTSAVDNAVQIPANATVLDLAKLSALQRFALKLSYSSRYRDVVWNIFKIKPSDARLVQSSMIKQKTHPIQIGETTQTSESTANASLGSFAGRGFSAGRNRGYHIFAEEPCVVLDFISFVPKAKYADAVHPLIHVDDILDFPIPDMDVLGNQPIYADSISGNMLDCNSVLGFGRQYQEWLHNYSTVHGALKTTLSYWNIIRRFSNTPSLNDDFLRIHPADNVDNIFSVKDSDHAVVDIFYRSAVTRHVHRNVRIMI